MAEKDPTEEDSYIGSMIHDLFLGVVEEQVLFPFPGFSSDDREVAKEITGVIKDFSSSNINSEKHDQEEEIPDAVKRGLAELGLYGLAVPVEFGGMGVNYGLYARICSEIAGEDQNTALLLGAHQSIGYRALLNEGSEEQKKKWLPSLSSGEKLAAFCLTEPGSGSDAYSIKTKAVGNDDGSFTITGQKLWITNAGSADFYTVFCKTEHSIDGKTKEKISAFIVEKGMEGLSFGEKEKKMGIRASETRAVYLDKVRVPAENVIGELGKGFKIAMNVLNSGRLSLASGCVGVMRYVLQLSAEHAATRKQFGRPIGEFGQIQDKLARMGALTYAAESIVYLTTGNIVRGMNNFSLESAACKVFASEALWEVADIGVQVAAGNGYMREYPYERVLRDARINLIFEGTNEILRCFIALSGIKGMSEDLKDLGRLSDISHALQDPIKSLGVLTNFARSRLSKIMPSQALSKHHPSLQVWAEHFTEMVSTFAIQVERCVMKHGKKIIDKQFAQKRIADMAIQLYVMLAVISRTSSVLISESASKEQKDYCSNVTDYICRNARYNFIANSKEMTRNIDATITSLSDYISKNKGDGLDIVDF